MTVLHASPYFANNRPTSSTLLPYTTLFRSQVFTSGESLTPSHVKKFNDVWGGKTGARLTNLYGPTEATVDVTYFDCPASNDFETIPIGRPIHNTKLYVIKDGQQTAIGEPGRSEERRVGKECRY